MSREEIIAANPIVDFVRSRGHELKPAGQNFVTNACPQTQHKHGHRPVMIYPETQSWSCHDCKCGGSVIDWVMIEQNVTVAEAMRILGGGGNEKEERGKIVCAYDYTDKDGKLLFQAVRLDPKDFYQQRPDGKGGWIKNLQGVRRVLYHLPEVLKAQTVCVAEGEKDADNLRKFGFVATTNPMGAGKWRDEYAETLCSKDVIVFGDVGDNNGDGERHTQRVIESLSGKAKSIKHVTLPDGFHDVSDYIASLPPETAAETIRKLVGETPLVELQSLARADGPECQEPQPLPEDMPAVPPFDYQCLPETLCPWIKDIAERMQCPPEFPAVSAMIALGSVLGRKIGIRPKRRDDWLELANLWGCIIGRPGLLKTPALQQALVHLRRLVAKAYEKYKEACQEHDISDMLRSQRKKIVKDQIANALKESAKKKNTSEKEQAEKTAREMAEKHLKEANEKPVCRRYEVNDSTIPKLGELLAENPNGLLLVRDELSGLLRELDCEEHAGDRAKYLEMWDGKGELTYDRIGRGTVRVPSNTLSILGGIQPDVVTPYVREAVRGGTGNDGLLQRIQLLVWPDVSKEWHNVDEWPDTEAKNQAFAVFDYLDKLAPEQVGADSSDGIPFLRFTDDAQECFDAWRAGLEKKLRSDVEHPAFEAHLSKYRKLVPVLALLIHLADRKSGRVSLSALSKALLWADYLEAHARRIYSVVLRPDTAAARELAKHLRHRDLPERFNLREVYRKGWAGLSDKEDAEAATEILCDLGWIRPAVDAPRRVPRTPGRSPSPIFDVNPLVFEPPLEGTDTTDTINSGVSVGDLQGVSVKSEVDSVSSVSDPEGVSKKSEASNSADHPQSSEHPSTPTDKTDTIAEQKRVGWV